MRTPKPAPPPTAASQIRKQLVEPELESGTKADLSRLQSAISVWHSAMEAEKISLDLDNVQRKARSERVRFWVPVLAPTISAIVVAATLAFQVIQFRINNELQRQSSEDQQWREVAQKVQDNSNKTAMLGLTLMESYFGSPKHGQEARLVAIFLLGHTIDREPFDLLFPRIVEHTSPANLKDLATLSNAMDYMEDQITEDLKTERASSKEPARPVRRIATMTAREPNQVNLESARTDIILRRRAIDEAMCKLLRDPHFRSNASEERVDLTGAKFVNTDLSRCDFSRAIPNNTTFNSCIVDKADFTDVAEPLESDWYYTAWWRANRIGPGLLHYLKRKTADHPGVGQAEYERAVASLESRR